MKSSLLLTFVAFFTTLGLHAQDVFFTQMYNNHLYLNPAFSGRETLANLGVQYSNQWSNLSYNFQTPSLQYDQRFQALNSGFGVLLMHDRFGKTFSTTTLGINYAYYVKLPYNFELSSGIQVGFGAKRVNWDMLTFGDMIDPQQGFIYSSNSIPANNTKTYPDLSTGFALSGRGLFAGISFRHLNRPNVSMITSESKLPLHINVHGGYNFRVKFEEENENKTLTITPNFSFYKQHQAYMYVFGLYMNYAGVTVGAIHRRNNVYGRILGYDFKFGRLAYSFENFTQLSTINSGGIHEVSLTWRLGRYQGMHVQRLTELPQF